MNNHTYRLSMHNAPSTSVKANTQKKNPHNSLVSLQNEPIVRECMSRPKEATVFDPNSKETNVYVFLNLSYMCVLVAQINKRPSRSHIM